MESEDGSQYSQPQATTEVARPEVDFNLDKVRLICAIERARSNLKLVEFLHDASQTSLRIAQILHSLDMESIPMSVIRNWRHDRHQRARWERKVSGSSATRKP